MKLRTSSFNATVFKKNLTRFAPCWGLYTIGALMGLILLLDSGSKHMAANLIDVIQILSVVTPCYALLCAQLLFGDLYNSRMCNALHALPMPRETWFFTNVVSGFVFHLIPTGVLTVLAAPILAFYSPENAVLAAPIFLLGTNLQFACFFGISVFSAFCVGNRFAHAVIYGMINFASALTAWLLDTLYLPQFYGIRVDFDHFLWFSPVGQLLEAPFIYAEHLYSDEFVSVAGFRYLPDDNFAYYFIIAATGIVLLFAAMALYRRRKLESAGDFLAIRVLEPVFLVIYSLIVGAAFYFITEDILGMETLIFLFAGLAVGWFTGKMLIERTPRVFRPKNFLHGAALMAAVALTIVTALLDPLGIEDWVPQVSRVESVTVSEGNYRYSQNEVTLEEPEDIARIIALHEAALEEHRQNYPHGYTFETAYKELVESTVEYIPGPMEHYEYFTISYKLTGDRTVTRYYRIWLGEEHGEFLRQISSTPEVLFGYSEDLPRFLAENSRLTVMDYWEGREIILRSQEDLAGLYQAILADCRAGNMAQSWTFHHYDNNVFWLYFENGTEITVYTSCENTLNWLRSYGLNVDETLEKFK